MSKHDNPHWQAVEFARDRGWDLVLNRDTDTYTLYPAGSDTEVAEFDDLIDVHWHFHNCPGC